MTPLRVFFGLMVVAGLIGSGAAYEAEQPSRTTPEKTIRVPRFKFACAREGPCRGLAAELTEAVVKAIEARTPYKVVASDDADTELTGTVKRFRRIPLRGRTGAGGPVREVETQLLVRLTWRDLRTGHSLLAGKSGSSLAAVELLSVAYYRPEVGQSVDVARGDNIQVMVGQILTQMETSW